MLTFFQAIELVSCMQNKKGKKNSILFFYLCLLVKYHIWPLLASNIYLNKTIWEVYGGNLEEQLKTKITPYFTTNSSIQIFVFDFRHNPSWKVTSGQAVIKW